MAKERKQRDSDLVSSFYGINKNTFKVESASCTRGGRLSLWREGGPLSHECAGRDPKSEMWTVFGVSDVISVPVGFESSEMTKQQVRKLEEKAAVMKKEAEAAAAKKASESN